MANIRGGGEYGPRWHQAALKKNRLRAYEDFAAIAEDLVARKVTSKERLEFKAARTVVCWLATWLLCTRNCSRQPFAKCPYWT